MHDVARGPTEEGFLGLLNKTSRAAAYLASASTFALMMIIVLDVVMRAFRHPIPGAFEFTEAILPIAVFLAFAYTEATGGNVRVTMLAERLPPRARAVLDVFVYAIGAVGFALLTWKTFEFAAASFDIREEAPGIVSFPVYPTKFAIALGCFLITLQFVARMASRVVQLITWKREG